MPRKQATTCRWKRTTLRLSPDVMTAATKRANWLGISRQEYVERVLRVDLKMGAKVDDQTIFG